MTRIGTRMVQVIKLSTKKMLTEIVGTGIASLGKILIGRRDTGKTGTRTNMP